MAKTLSSAGIETGQLVEPHHVSQSVEALNGSEAYNITISGSLTITGSTYLQKDNVLSTPQSHVLSFDDTTGQIFKATTSSLEVPSSLPVSSVAGFNQDKYIPKVNVYDNDGDRSPSGDNTFLIGTGVLPTINNTTRDIVNPPTNLPNNQSQSLEFRWEPSQPNYHLKLNRSDFNGATQVITGFWTNKEFTIKAYGPSGGGGGISPSVLTSGSYKVGLLNKTVTPDGKASITGSILAKNEEFYYISLEQNITPGSSVVANNLIYDLSGNEFSSANTASIGNFVALPDPTNTFLDPFRMYRKQSSTQYSWETQVTELASGSIDSIVPGLIEGKIDEVSTIAYDLDAQIAKINKLPNTGDSNFTANGIFPNTGQFTIEIHSSSVDVPIDIDRVISASWSANTGQKNLWIQNISPTIDTTAIISTWISGPMTLQTLGGGSWRNIIKYDQYQVGNIIKTSNSDFSTVTKVLNEINGYYFIHMEYTFTSTGTNQILLSADAAFPAEQGGIFDVDGSIEFANFCVFVDPDIKEVNPWLIYRNETLNDWTTRVEEVSSGSINDIVPDLISASISAITGSEGVGTTTIEKYVYGAHIQNFMAKAREFTSGRVFSKPPKTVVIGDSILTQGTGNEKSYAHYLREHFSSSLGLPTSSFEIHAYGGKNYGTFIPFIEDIMVNNNPDLVILAEYEYPSNQQGLSRADEYVVLNDFIIKMIKKNTSADIALSTWSLNQSTAEVAWSGSLGLGGVGIDDYKSEDRYLKMNYVRDLARKHNCELIDVNQAGIDHIQETQVFPDLGGLATWPHCFPLYSTAFTSESIKHFVDNGWSQNLNLVNPHVDKEELITSRMGLLMDKFSESNFSSSGLQSGIGQYVPSTGTYEVRSNSDLYIDLDDSIGFELYCENKTSVYGVNPLDFEELFILRLSNDGGNTYHRPSQLTYNGYPLEYATNIRLLPFTDDTVTWASRRPMKKAVVESSLSESILAPGTGSSGQYIIEIRETGSIREIPDNQTIKLSGSYQEYFNISTQFRITGSANNNGTYTIDTFSYDGTFDVTQVTIDETLASTTADGVVVTEGLPSDDTPLYVNNQDAFPLLLCDIKDPSSTTLATFVSGYETASIYGGKVKFPLGYNGYTNYTLASSIYDPADPTKLLPTPGDQYGFYFVSNWNDSIRPAISQSINTLSTPEINTNPLYEGTTTEFQVPLMSYETVNMRTDQAQTSNPKFYLKVFGYEKSNWKLKIALNPDYNTTRKLYVLGVNNIKSKNL